MLRVCDRFTVQQKGLTNEINSFGAVLEDFEVKDSLSGILATKVDSYAGFKDDDFMNE